MRLLQDAGGGAGALAGFVESLPLNVALLEASEPFRILYMNAAWESEIDVARLPVAGKPWLVVFPGHSHREMETMFASARGSAEPIYIDSIAYKRRHGDSRDWCIYPLSSDHRVTHLLVSCTLGSELRGRRKQRQEMLQLYVKALEAVAAHAAAPADMSPFFGQLTGTVASLVHARMVSFALWNGVDVLIPQPGSFGIDPELLPTLSVPCRSGNDGLAERIVFHDHVFRGRNTRQPELEPYQDRIEAVGGVDAISCAWKAGDRRLGSLTAFNSSRPGGFTESDVAVLQIAAEAAGLLWQQKQTERELLATVTRLREVERERTRLLQKLIEVGDEERKRLTRELHDDSLQMLAAVQIRIESLRRRISEGTERSALDSLAGTVEQTMHRMRHLIFDLRPEMLDRDGLEATIGVLLAQAFTDSGVTCRLRWMIRDEPGPSTRHALYRICREALANVRRHAGAQHVEIVVEEVEDGLMLSVTDDGVGFALSDSRRPDPGHLGLISMREQAEFAGGMCNIRSRRGAGCTVEVWVPLHRKG